jgi:hypothetical protein
MNNFREIPEFLTHEECDKFIDDIKCKTKKVNFTNTSTADTDTNIG